MSPALSQTVPPWRQALGTVLHNPQWWHQQTWVAATEVLVGFLAVLGMARGFGVAEVATGLAMAYAVAAAGVRPLVHGTRRAAVLGMLVAWVGIAAALVAPATSLLHWAGLCVACGMLLAFRDAQTVQSMAWMPVRAARRRAAAFQVSQWAIILGTLYLGAWMTASGFLMAHWEHWPLVLVALTLALGVPQAIHVRPRTHRWRRRGRRPCPMTQGTKQQLSWMYRLAVPMNAAHFVGRRLVLPAAVVKMAHDMGWGAKALPVLGLTLGVIAILAVAMNLWMSQHGEAEREAERQLQRGIGFTVLGWLWIVLGLVGGAASGWGWVLLLAGWVFIDVAARMVGVGYMETLRFLVNEGRPTRARVHRHALSRFMRIRSAGGVAGLAMAAATHPIVPGILPIWVSVWVAGCWWVWAPKTGQ